MWNENMANVDTLLTTTEFSAYSEMICVTSCIFSYIPVGLVRWLMKKAVLKGSHLKYNIWWWFPSAPWFPHDFLLMHIDEEVKF